MRTNMAPFPTQKPRVCENPECKPASEGGKHRKDCTIGAGGAPNEFEPKTPWQKTCCVACRNRRNWIEVRGPKYRAEIEARGGPKKRGRPKKSSDQAPADPPADHQTKPDDSVGEIPF